MCVHLCEFLCTTPVSRCPRSPEEGTEFLTPEAAGDCELPCRCWEPNPGLATRAARALNC